jgi:hypothetical protein
MLKIVLSLLLLLPFAGRADEKADFARMVGKYVGEVYNGNDMDPVMTTFILLPDGRLKGNYVAQDEVEVVEGTISNAYNIEGRTYSFEWTDKYGEGQAVLIFSEDFSSFDGFWTEKSGSDELPWTGQKE